MSAYLVYLRKRFLSLDKFVRLVGGRDFTFLFCFSDNTFNDGKVVCDGLCLMGQTLVYAGGKGLGLPRTTERVLSFIPCQQFPMIAYTPSAMAKFSTFSC